MTAISFAAIMDRSRLDRLEHDLALYVLELLKTYTNEDDKVHLALLDAGHSIYNTKFISLHGYNDIIIAECERLLRLARKYDGAWESQPNQVDAAIAAAANKIDATREDIEAEIIAGSPRFTEMGYKPVEIARSLARVALTFAPIGFIARHHDLLTYCAQGRDERLKAFLDEALGEDRYGSGKKQH
jgi:hypothetical protein